MRPYHLAAALVLLLAAAAPAQELEVTNDVKFKHNDFGGVGIRRLGFSADGKTLFTAGYNCVRVWDVTVDPPKPRAAAAQIKTLGRSGLWDAAISPDGKRIAVGGDKIMVLYDLSDSTLTERASQRDQAGSVRALSFTPDGRYLAAGSDDKTVYVYDLSGDKPREKLVFRPEKVGSAMAGLHFRADGRSILFAYQGGSSNVGVEDVTGKEGATLGAVSEKNVTRTAVSADGKLLALFAGKDIKLFDVSGAVPKLRPEFKGVAQGAQGMGLAFSPDGKLLASAGKDQKCMVWNVATGQKLLTKIYTGDVEDVTFDPSAGGTGGVYRLAVPTHQRDAHLLTLRLK